MSLLSIAFILFLIMDPIGSVTSYLKLVQDLPPKKQRWIVIREMLIALAAMFIFYFIGEYLLAVLHISPLTVRLSSGAVLFLVAIKILFPSKDSPRNNLPQGEPFITPLAIPLIAGPALLATIMLFAHAETNHANMIGGIILAWCAAVIVLELSPFLQKYVGKNGLQACERLMGMILVMLAIQRFFEGIQEFVLKCQTPLV